MIGIWIHLAKATSAQPILVTPAVSALGLSKRVHRLLYEPRSRITKLFASKTCFLPRSVSRNSAPKCSESFLFSAQGKNFLVVPPCLAAGSIEDLLADRARILSRNVINPFGVGRFDSKALGLELVG